MPFVKDKLTVLIGTCDKYEPLWENFTTCFNKYWQIDTRNIFVGETKPIPGFESVLPGLNLPWGQRMLEGIKECSEYIFFLLDDYFLSDYWTEDLIKNYVKDIIKYNFNSLLISPSDFQTCLADLNSPYSNILDTSEYIISMQPTIWRKDYLQQVLLSHYSPWDFELTGSYVLNTQKTQETWKAYKDISAPSRYFNAVRKGFIKNPRWEEFKEKENLKDF